MENKYLWKENAWNMKRVSVKYYDAVEKKSFNQSKLAFVDCIFTCPFQDFVIL